MLSPQHYCLGGDLGGGHTQIFTDFCFMQFFTILDKWATTCLKADLWFHKADLKKKIGCNFCDELFVSKVRFIKEYWGKSLYKLIDKSPCEYKIR